MTMILYKNESDRNELPKMLTEVKTIVGTLKTETSITDPVIMIESDNPLDFNYVYISEFRRFYYVEEITTVRNGLIRVRLHVDVLTSHMDSILSLMCVVSNSESSEINNNYLNSDVWVATARDTTTVLNFQNGLLESGEYILLTAGG